MNIKMSTTLSFVGQKNKWDKAEDVVPVVEAINAVRDIRCLKLEANTLGVEAAKAIGDALAHHPEFERAHWKDLFTGRLKSEIPEALKHLFSGLIRAGAKLKELDLSDNALGPVGVEGMVDFMSSPVCYSLEELRLNNNGLGINGGTMLAESLMQLVENAKAAGSPLRLKVFIAGRNRLEKEGAIVYSKFFRAVGTLEEVAMPQNGIFHEGIAALAEAFSVNKNLRIINLNDNTFTPKGAAAMAKYLPAMQNLEVINFGDCLLKTQGAVHIAKAIEARHSNLKELLLDSNEITIIGGLAIAEAIANKDSLERLNLDANQFGEDGCVSLRDLLDTFGRLDNLDTLDDDEEPDSDDEDEEDGSDDDDDDEDDDIDDDDDEDEEEEEEEEDEEEGVHIMEPKECISPLRRGEAKIKTLKCTVAEFRSVPSAGRLLGLGAEGPSEMVEELKNTSGSDETFISSCVDMLMRTASLTQVNNSKVLEAAKVMCCTLAEKAFEVAQQKNIVSVVTNELLVYLGLIKCEDKKFRVEWHLKHCLNILRYLVTQPFFPKDTKNILQYFFSKPHATIDLHEEEKHKLMIVLYQ